MMIGVQGEEGGSRAGGSKLNSATQQLWVQIPTLLRLAWMALDKPKKRNPRKALARLRGVRSQRKGKWSSRGKENSIHDWLCAMLGGQL